MSTSPALHLRGIAYVELYVANLYQAAFFYTQSFGFTPVGVTPTSADRDHVSMMLEQGGIRLVLTSGTNSQSVVAQHVHEHGDTVRDVAFVVDDAMAAFSLALSRGGQAAAEPQSVDRNNGQASMIRTMIRAPGDTVHSFVQLTSPVDGVWPGFQAVSRRGSVDGIGLIDVDHVAVGLDTGSLDHWVEFYKSVLGFRKSHEEMIWTARSGMNSKVVEDTEGRVRIPLVETAGGARRSQIDDYLANHKGPGAQHVAFRTKDILTTIEALIARGVRFLDIPQTYYEDLRERIPDLDPTERERVEATGVLVDSESDGLLMQAFTEPLHHRPTMFAELIERRGARGFGGRNIQALFEAVERDQAQRGMAVA
jgi:4-hydroxyphenylpyruvate dioxygenase